MIRVKKGQRWRFDDGTECVVGRAACSRLWNVHWDGADGVAILSSTAIATGTLIHDPHEVDDLFKCIGSRGGITTRTLNVLTKLGVESIEQLRAVTKPQVFGVPFSGASVWREVQRAQAEVGGSVSPEERIAREMHESERSVSGDMGVLAPLPWGALPENNRQLMTAVVRDLLRRGVIEAPDPTADPSSKETK